MAAVTAPTASTRSAASVALRPPFVAPQVVFLAVWMAYSPPSRASFALVGLIAFAMGVQMNAIRFLHVPSISTTAATATFISLVSGIATRSLTASAVRRLSGVLVSIAVGSLLGVLMLRYVHREAPVLPVVVNATVLGIAAVVLKQSSVDGGPLPQGTVAGGPGARL